MEEEVKEAQCAHSPPLDNDDVIGSNQYLCLPKAELNTRNSTKRQLCCRLVEFLVLNTIHSWSLFRDLPLLDPNMFVLVCERFFGGPIRMGSVLKDRELATLVEETSLLGDRFPIKLNELRGLFVRTRARSA